MIENTLAHCRRWFTGVGLTFVYLPAGYDGYLCYTKTNVVLILLITKIYDFANDDLSSPNPAIYLDIVAFNKISSNLF